MNGDAIRRITGYIALAVIALYWLWLLTSTAPQLRRRHRDGVLRTKIRAVQTLGFVTAAAVVIEIHFLATSIWQVLLVLVLALVLARLLRQKYLELVPPPRHRNQRLVDTPTGLRARFDVPRLLRQRVEP